MTNEEKAREIAFNNCSHVGCSHGEHYFDSTEDCYNSAIIMAEWKEKQMIEKAVEWLDIELSCGDLNKEKKDEILKLFSNAMTK